MHNIAKQFEKVRQVLLLCIGGLSFDVLRRFAEQGIMPNLAKLLPTLARAELRQAFFSSPNASWATLETGQDSNLHGVLDDFMLDHPRQRLMRSFSPEPTATARGGIVIQNTASPQRHRRWFRAKRERIEKSMIWSGKPADRQGLERGLARMTEILLNRFAEVRAEYASGKRRLVMLKLTVFDSFFLRLWHLLGTAEEPGGRRSWIAETQRIFRTLDDQLATLFDFAARDRSAIVLMSPYGFVPLREKIILNELLRRKGLLHVAEGRTRFRYECARFFAKRKKRVGLADREEHPLSGLLPIDWRRTRAVSLHGENAALVYLNTPERFGGGPLTTPSQCEATQAEVLAAIVDARHPLSGERLFSEAFSTGERFGIDPLEKRWPEVIGIPAPGYQVRQRFDHARQLVRPDASIAGARTGVGFLCWQAPGVSAGDYGTLDLSEVMGIMYS